jgi:hypothetical protein
MKKIFIIIIAAAIIIIVLAIISISSYKIFTKKSPAQAYLDICKELDGAKDYNAIRAFLQEYTTQAFQDGLQVRGVPSDLPSNSEEENQRSSFLKSLIMGVPSSRLQVYKEDIKGDIAYLYFSDKANPNSPSLGRVTMKLEGGNWKINEESWVYDFVPSSSNK